MKSKLLYLLLALFLVISACNDEEEDVILERGALISYFSGSDFSVTYLESLFNIFLGDESSRIDYKYAVQLISLKYQTIDPMGNPIQASGLVVIPNSSNAKPLLSFAHGTILNKNDVPSMAGGGREAGLLYGSEGYVTVLADFIGLGSSEGLHPYMHAESEATASIDMLRATQHLCKDLNVTLDGRLFITGYSQGGHVAMATHKYIQEEYSSEFTVTASAPLAGPFDVSGIMLDTLLLQKEFIEPAFLPYMLFAYNPIYKLFDDINSIFVSPYNTSLETYIFEGTTSNLVDVSAILPESRIPSAILKTDIYEAIRDDANHPVREALADNNLYDWKPEAPVFLIHCDGDITVPSTNSKKAYEYFIRNGATNVDIYNPSDSLGHIGCVVPAIIKSLEWFNTFN